jgi:MoaA/NifB/PqqE/SkfB family radical SAM enzyme
MHDAIRRAPGLYASLGSGIRSLAIERQKAGSQLTIRANVVLMHHTIRSFGQLCDELAEWGVNEISFNQLGGNDRPEFYPTNRLQPADTALLEATLPNIREKLSEHGVRLLGAEGYLSRMSSSSRNECVPIQDCRPGHALLFIDRESRIAPCSFTAESHGIPLAEITSVKEMRNLSARFIANLHGHRPTACDDCLSTRVFAKFAT